MLERASYMICETFELGDVLERWCPRWKIPLKNLWKCHFWDSKFQDVPRYLIPQEFEPLVRVPKLPTIHYQPAA